MIDRQFQVGEHVFLKVKPKKSTLNLGNYSKLTGRYSGSFEILANIRPISYELSFPLNIKAHKVSLVSFLKKYMDDVRHVIDWNMIQVNCIVDAFVLH